MISHEIFYSPILGEEDMLSESDRDIEELPQQFQRVNRGGRVLAFDRRKSDVDSQFFGKHHNNDDFSLQVSSIEHAKRDEILDDSLMFAL